MRRLHVTLNKNKNSHKFDKREKNTLIAHNIHIN